MTGIRICSFLAGVAMMLAAGLPATAQDRITIQVGYGPGGGYDGVARMIAGLLPDHLPGTPDIIVENVPGAGSLALARMVMVDANRRGTRLATIASALALSPVFQPETTDFDPRAVHYIAALSNAASYCIASRASGITDLRGLLDTPGVRIGATGRSSSTYTFPAALGRALGGQFEIVVGFAGGPEIDLAMVRGDVEARCGVGLETINETGLRDDTVIVAELAVSPRNEVEGVDFALDLVTDPDLRAALALVFASSSIHHPYVMAPQTPPEHVATMRAAFAAMVASPEFAAVNAARDVPFAPTVGADLVARIEAVLDQPDHIRELARTLVE
jgi:tripartite-type tricarboxylate transporter receptor subunit TctC